MCSKQKQGERETACINTFVEAGGIIIGWVGPWQTLTPPAVCLSPACTCSVFVRVCWRASKSWWLRAHFRDLSVCKAVSVDIASMEERFLHSLRYTLINLLKPARPVSNTLTHQKSQTALNPTRIFWFMDGSGKSFQPHIWQLSVRVCRNAYKIETNIHLIIFMMDIGRGGSYHKGVMKPPQTAGLLVYIADLHPLPPRWQTRPQPTDEAIYGQ